MAAGCFGLVKTLSVETEHLFCRAIDIDPELDHKHMAKRLVDELHDHNVNLTDVGVTAEARRTFDVIEASRIDTIKPLPENLCFIVTGGARGITAECIRKLAERQSGRYLLLGRTPFDGEEPDWALKVPDADLKAKAAAHLKDTQGKATPKAINELVNRVQGHREIHNTLKRLERCDVSTRYVAMDISDAEAVRTWTESDDWLRDSDSLALIHGAGALADKRIEDKQMAEVKRVFSAKLYGLSNLLAHLDLSKLQFACLFSSVAGLFGNVGQVDYAMSNEILNRMALALQPRMAQDGRTLSIIWGAWNAGMVTPAIKKMFESRGIALIEEDEGSSHFAELCLSDNTKPLMMVGPSSGLSTRRTEFSALSDFHSEVLLSTRALSTSKLLSHHAIGGEVVLPATFAMGWVANVIENCFAGVVVTGCERMNVNKGLVLTRELPERLLLAIHAKGVGDDQRLLLDAVIRNPANGQVHYSYRGIELSHDLTSDHRGSIAIELNKDNGSELYRDQTLFHGDAFQLLKSYQQTDEKEMLFTCRWLPRDELHLIDGHSTRAFCPMHADALLQAALVWVKKYEGLPSLPMVIEDLRCHQPIDRGETLCIRVELAEQSDSQSTLYLSALKPNGHVHLAMKAAVVKSAALAQKFGAETTSAQ